jgi:hypothetical protein
MVRQFKPPAKEKWDVLVSRARAAMHVYTRDKTALKAGSFPTWSYGATLAKIGRRYSSGFITKEVAGLHVLLKRSLFACNIPRRLPLRVSLAKPLFVRVRF